MNHSCENPKPAPFIPCAQSILSAPDPEKLSQGMQDLNGWLAVNPVEHVLYDAPQLTSIAEKQLVEAVQEKLDTLPAHTVRACRTALDDLSVLCRPVFHAPVLSTAAMSILHTLEDLDSLDEYLSARHALWGEMQALEKAEWEAVSGRLYQKLAGLVIRCAIPDLIYQNCDPVLNRRYELWTQLDDCRSHGLEDLAPYFLKARGNCVYVLLPPAMPPHNSAEDYYVCARTLSILYDQIPVCQRKTLFEGLLSAVEYDAMDAVVNGKSGKETDAICDLYLAMQAEKSTGYLRYWQAICYARHALDKNTKNDKEET